MMKACVFHITIESNLPIDSKSIQAAPENEAKKKKVWRIAMHKIIIFVQSMILVNKIVSNVFFLYRVSFYSLFFPFCAFDFFSLCFAYIGVSVTV